MLSRLARFTYRRRRAVVVISVLFAALAATAGGPVAGLLKGGGFDDPRAENVAARGLIEKETGLDSSQAVIALVDAGAPVRTSPVAQAEVARVVKVLRADPGIGSVIDAFTTGTQALVSKDGLSTYIVAIPRAMGEDAEIALGKRLTDQLSGDPQVLLGGGIVAQNQVEDLVAHGLARAEAIAFPLLFLLLLVVFRGLVAALLPVILGGLAIVTAFLGLRIVNSFTDISIFALNLVTGLGLGLAIDYSLLVVSRYREESAIVGHGSAAALSPALPLLDGAWRGAGHPGERRRSPARSPRGAGRAGKEA